MMVASDLMSLSGAIPATVTTGLNAMGAYVSELYSENPNLPRKSNQRRILNFPRLYWVSAVEFIPLKREYHKLWNNDLKCHYMTNAR